MGDLIELTPDEFEVLEMALTSPVCDPEPEIRRLCINLQARRLLQPAGALSLANGWCGSPRAFVLSRDGWNRLKARRRTGAASRLG
jgi:hypothetical protein